MSPVKRKPQGKKSIAQRNVSKAFMYYSSSLRYNVSKSSPGGLWDFFCESKTGEFVWVQVYTTAKRMKLLEAAPPKEGVWFELVKYGPNHKGFRPDNRISYPSKASSKN